MRLASLLPGGVRSAKRGNDITSPKSRTLALLGGLATACLLAVTPVSAAPAGSLAVSAGLVGLTGAADVLVHKVQQRSYRRGRHGNRFRSRRRGFSHFYDGYYYAVPWWEDDYYDDEQVYDRGGGYDDEDH